jgi:hypothetical protein
LPEFAIAEKASGQNTEGEFLHEFHEFSQIKNDLRKFLKNFSSALVRLSTPNFAFLTGNC